MNQIYYVGYDAIHPDNFIYDVPEGFHNFLLIITTPALFHIGETVSEYPAHTCILYPPGCPIWYGAAGRTYGNHWLRFASDESFVTNFPQLAMPFLISDPEYCHNLFQLITWETSQVVVSQLLRILFGKLSEMHIIPAMTMSFLPYAEEFWLLHSCHGIFPRWQMISISAQDIFNFSISKSSKYPAWMM